MTDHDADADDGPATRLLSRDSLLLVVVLFVGIAGTGTVRRQLGLWGLNNLGRIVFVLGYGGTVLLVWYGWVRPLDITGPDGDASPYTKPDEQDEQ